MLFYREALRREARMSAERMMDVNAGTVGGGTAEARLARLSRLLDGQDDQ